MATKFLMSAVYLASEVSRASCECGTLHFVNMVRPEGIEPPAYRFEACRSIQLSYGRPVRP